MTKLEQVARVICDYPMGPSDFNSCCSDPMGEKRCQVKARAAVEALQGADDEMTAAGGRVIGDKFFDDSHYPCIVAASTWRAMIIAILSEKPE